MSAGRLQRALRIDPTDTVAEISERIRQQLSRRLKRRGLVVGLSGGVDSSVTLALSVAALGVRRVLALLMPERDSAEETLGLSRRVADHFGVEAITEEITPMLEAAGFYRRYDGAVQRVVPEYGAGWKSKIVTSSIFEHDGFPVFSLVARAPDGRTVSARLPLQAHLEIVAATSFKQRSRKMLEYYHADRRHYAVAGTPNRLEYDQGFFVKNGDGAADIKPIAHLYKTQVYQLATHMGVPPEICRRVPTTDTYSLAQDQTEFFFSLPLDKLDLCLYAKNHGIDPREVATEVGLSADQVRRVYADIDRKRSGTRYLHLAPLLVGAVPEVEPSQPTANGDRR